MSPGLFFSQSPFPFSLGETFGDAILEEDQFLNSLNSNFPADFRAISIQKIPIDFNIINSNKTKEYHYYFSFGEKNHPFAAPFMSFVEESLDIDLMKTGAKLFEGESCFQRRSLIR